MKLNIQMFALTEFYLNKVTGDASWKSLRGLVKWEERNVSIENNTSSVYTELWARTWTGGTSGKNWGGQVSVNGTNSINFSSLSSQKSIAADYVLLASGTVENLQHNDDGSLNVSLYGKVVGCTGTSISGLESKKTTTITLTKIARASTVTCDTDITIGNGLKIYSNRKSSTFCHTVAITFGGFSKTENFTTDSYTWMTGSDADGLYEEMPSSTTGTGTITLTTYTDSTYVTPVGSPTSTSFRLYSNENACQPTISETSYQDTNSIITALTGSNQILVAGYSKPRITWSDSAKYYYSITSRKVNGTSATSPYTFTSYPSSMYITVVDNIGRTASYTYSPTIKQYFNPTLNVSLTRPQPTDGSAKLEIKGIFWNSSFGSVSNSLTTFKYRYKKSTDSTYSSWTTVTPTISGNNYSYSYTWTTGFDYQSNYDFQVSVSDRLVDYTEKPYTLVKGTPIMAMGEDEVEVNGNFNVSGTLTGNLTGNVTGNVSGSSSSCTGNSATATKLSSYNTGRSASGTAFLMTCSGGGGVMEIGKYLDFHNSNSSTADYDVRLYCNGTTGASVAMPTSSGTLALTSQLPTIQSSIVATTDGAKSYYRIGDLLVCWGQVSITPTANTPTKVTVTFPKAFASRPSVVCNMNTSVPYTTARAASATNVSATSADIYITRTNTTETGVNWIAIGQTS